MNKSEQYHIAQIAVINSVLITPEVKLEVLKTLIDEEKFQVIIEGRKEVEQK